MIALKASVVSVRKRNGMLLFEAHLTYLRVDECFLAVLQGHVGAGAD